MKQPFFINRVICETCVTISIIMNSITQVSHALCDSQGTQVMLWSRAVKHVIICACILSVRVTHSKPALVLILQVNRSIFAISLSTNDILRFVLCAATSRIKALT